MTIFDNGKTIVEICEWGCDRVLISENKNGITELVREFEHPQLAAKDAEIARLRDERNTIARHIRITLDDGTAPDNLADHVLLAMQEYDSMSLRINALRGEG